MDLQLVLGGATIRPVAWAGPFVTNTKADVLQALRGLWKGRFGQIPTLRGAPTDTVEG